MSHASQPTVRRDTDLEKAAAAMHIALAEARVYITARRRKCPQTEMRVKRLIDQASAAYTAATTKE